MLSVHRLFQDSEGYLWYGTVDGLCRDDGYEIKLLRNDFLHPQPLSSNLILTIAEDSLHRILFGTPSGAFLYSKTDRQVRPYCPETLLNQQVQEIFCASDGTVHLSTAHHTYAISTDARPVKTADDVSSRFFQTSDGTLLSGFNQRGLCRYDPQKHSWNPIDTLAAHLPVSDMEQVGHYLWLTSRDRGIVRMDLQAQSVAERYTVQPPVKNALGQPVFHYFYLRAQQDGKRLWVTSNDDLHSFDIDSSGSLHPVDLSRQLQGYTPGLKMLNEVIRTRDGSIWVAGYDRESFVIDFETFNRERYDVPPLAQRFSRSILLITLCRDEGSRYWISQERVGLCLYDTGTGQLTTFADCPTTRHARLEFVHELIPSAQPHLVWTVTASDYVFGVRSVGMQMQLVHTLQLPDGQHAKTLFEDRDGSLWIGTYDGIFRYTPSDRTLHPVSPTAGHTTSFTQAPDGTLYATITGTGIAVLTRGKIQKTIPLQADLLCIASTPDGTLWIGTGAGQVLKVKPGKWHVEPLQIAALNGDMIEKIVPDNDGHLWILTNQRLIEYDLANDVCHLVSAGSAPQTLRRFMPRAISLHQPTGDILVGGFGGMLVCRPSSQLEGTPHPVHVSLTDVRIGDGQPPVRGDGIHQPLTLPSDAQNIEFHFSALDHLHASTQRYAYRLDDGTWNQLAVGQNSFHLQRLTAGRHSLQLRTTDRKGRWSSDIATYQILRTPHWYETTLAYALYVLTALLLIILLIRYFMLRTRREEERIWSDSAELVAMHQYVTERPKREATASQGVKGEVATGENASPSTLHPSPYATIDQMLLDRARSITLQHLGDADFGVETLAQHMNMSRSTLVRKLKSITGQTPLQFIRDVKMDEARRLLQSRSATVADVAQRLGYSDREHFSRIFREVTGQLPSEWQKQQGQ